MADDGHGGKIYAALRKYGKEITHWLDFSANINPLGLNPNIAQAIGDNIQQLIHYPDDGGLLQRMLAEELGVKQEQVILTNGAAEAFFVAVNALEPRSALLLEPTFSEYRRSLEARNVTIEEIILTPQEDFQPRWAEVEKHWKRDMLMVICNPNNPTGLLTKKADLLRQADLAKRYSGWLLVDESFQDFLTEQCSLLPFLSERTVIVRSLTKFFALPGLRLGYMVAPLELLPRLRRQIPAWNVNTLALVAGRVALSEKEYILQSREILKKDRADFCEKLRKLPGITIYPRTGPMVNFVLFHLEREGDLAEYLLTKGILIRSCNNFKGLGKEWFRCAVRSLNENNKIIAALEEYLEVKN